MTENPGSAQLLAGDQVQHSRFGFGRVEINKVATAIVRFDHGFEECPIESLEWLGTLTQSIKHSDWGPALPVLARMQAEAVRSINEAWGVFSRSRIELLPHQLWVCKIVNETWPARWLVADDVGLGKTIEAGLIISPLLASGRVRRLLILCPASLVEQWQFRLRTMFDVRLASYHPDLDTARTDFWGAHPQVVVSLQTLRLDRENRHERLLESDPWDLVVVDEAHHLNADENAGPTLGYRLIDGLNQAGLVESMVFFTGTPHRGKDFGFFSLMSLLRPDLFDPREPGPPQLRSLSHAMVRNNKQNVTDLKGQRLFMAPRVYSETYHFSEAEALFYNMLSEFIVAGKAYASSLDSTNGRAVVLVLIAMQKLASSSVAAVRRALKGRHNRILQTREKIEDLKRRRDRLATGSAWTNYLDMEAGNDFDSSSKIEEEIAELSADLPLMEDEEPRLKQLIAAAEAIRDETKIQRLMDAVDRYFTDIQVLLFTEYKATQSLVMSALMQKYGDGTVAFINGDDRAEEVRDSAGQVQTLNERREAAAARFNDGRIRFLVSTEAGGEGIDLQERCHALIHVDLPWNPMRLHQRVGRLNRYGQKQQVEVVLLRNPETVESLIWDKLNEKIASITRALSEVVEEPEDLLDLVLGMASPSLFTDMFSGARSLPPESLSSWFNQRTASFGGLEAIEAVREIVGNCSRFDFRQCSEHIPRVDLPDLAPFFKTMVTLGGRKVQEEGGRISFRTPDSWREKVGVRANYQDLTFDRDGQLHSRGSEVIGFGHRAFGEALNQALRSTPVLGLLPATRPPIFAFAITDRLTGATGVMRHGCVGWKGMPGTDGARLLRDWELLLELNEMSGTSGLRAVFGTDTSIKASEVESALRSATSAVESSLSTLDMPFTMPAVAPVAVLWPRT